MKGVDWKNKVTVTCTMSRNDRWALFDLLKSKWQVYPSYTHCHRPPIVSSDGILSFLVSSFFFFYIPFLLFKKHFRGLKRCLSECGACCSNMRTQGQLPEPTRKPGIGSQVCKPTVVHMETDWSQRLAAHEPNLWSLAKFSERAHFQK